MDSFALAYMMRPEVLLTIDYGQLPAAAELQAGTRLSEALDLAYKVVSVDLSELGSGDLSGKPSINIAPESEWWPFRNQMLLTIAAMALIAEGVQTLMIGTVSTDSFHMDGSKDFIESISKTVRLQEGRLEIEAPAIELTTVELVERSGIPIELLAWSHSCHTSNIACGRCRGCNKHREVMSQLGYA